MKAKVLIGISLLLLASIIFVVRVSATTTHRPQVRSATAIIYEPEDGATVSGTVTIEVYAYTDDYMDAYLYIDGELFAEWSDKGTKTFEWDTTQYSDGTHEIKLYVEEYWIFWFWKIIVSTAEDVHQVTVDNSGPDTTPPTVTITSPQEGETVTSSDVTVTWTGSDDKSGINHYEIQLDTNGWINVGTSTSYTFHDVSDGTHTVEVRAYDNAGNVGSDTVTFTVNTSAAEEGPIVYTFTGTISKGEDSQRHQFDVPSTATRIEVTLEMPDGADFDLSVWDDQGRRTGGWTSTESTTREDIPNSDYSGYSADPEWVTVDPVASFGTWETGCYAYSGSGTYTITVKIYTSSGGGGGEGDGVVNKYAVIVGISDYKAISDLSYCDEDATDWYNHLVNNLGWSPSNIKVLGDTHDTNYPKYDGLATEYNVKEALKWMVSTADADDIIAFISSGHGAKDSNGAYLCMWDCSAGENGEDGNLYDFELAGILDDAVAAKIFVFLDHCHSGGFGDDLMNMPNSEHVYLTTTCTENGYGYDDPNHQNGAWTYYFLEYSWIGYYGGSPDVSMEEVFAYAHDAYPYGGADEPQEFDGDPNNSFYLK